MTVWIDTHCHLDAPEFGPTPRSAGACVNRSEWRNA
jgi:hypothetical protein